MTSQTITPPGPGVTRSVGDRTQGRIRRARTGPGRRLGAVGLTLLLLLLGMAVFAPLSPYDPQVASGQPYAAPSAQHLLGTNDIGQDIFTELLYGTRLSGTIGLLAALFALALGLTVALVAGYFRAPAAAALMRLVDFTLAFPFLPLVIVLAAFLGRGLLTTVLVIAAVIWARPARVLRSQVLKVREYPHVVGAHAMGASAPYILVRHVLPRIAPLAVTQFVRAANVAVLLEASLAFLGLGDPSGESWGTMLFFANSHNAFLTRAWLWWIVPPGLALTAMILGLAFLGYGIEEWADPRLSLPAGRPGRVHGAAPLAAPVSLVGPAVLAVQDLRVEYDTPGGTVQAVNGVSFSILPGQIVGLVGESGCGKSTLALTILRLLQAPGRLAGGRILLRGLDLAAQPPAALTRIRGRQIGLVPQSAMNALNPAYTIHRQVAESAALTRLRADAAARAHALLDLVGIPPARHAAYPHELSGGMRQRVVLAMAVANDPALLIADEPLTGLDVVTQAHILRLLCDLRDRFGMAVLLISHDLPAVGRVADRMLVMYAGRIVESGPAAQVHHQPRHPYTAALLGAFPDVHGPRRPIVSIAGEPPDLVHPPSGCRFHPRCLRVFNECPLIDPPLFESVPGHLAACLLERP